MSTAVNPPISRVRWLLSWAVLPALVVMQFFDLRRALFGPLWIWSSFLVGFALVVLVCAPLVRRHLSELTTAGRWVVAAASALLGYALVTAVITARPYLTSRTTPQSTPPDVWAPVPDIFRTVPVVTAFVTMAAAVLLVWVTPERWRLHRLWWAAWTIVVTSFIAFPRSIINQGSDRLATGMGGSATVHLVFLLCLGIFLGALVQRFHLRWSALGAAASTVLILLTGSRAGALSLALLVGLLVLWWAGRVSWKLVAGLVAAGGALLAVGYLISAQVRRLFTGGDPLRAANLERAITIWTLGWRQVVFGAGSGRVWPWYAYEAKFFLTPWRGLAATPFGPMLTNPHSVVLGVVVELGLVGALLGAVVVTVPTVVLIRRWRAWRASGSSTRWSQGMRTGALLAVVAGFLSFVFDYYLFKSFAVAFWWWFVLSVAVLLPATPPQPARPEPATSDAPAQPEPAPEQH